MPILGGKRLLAGREIRVEHRPQSAADPNVPIKEQIG